MVNIVWPMIYLIETLKTMFLIALAKFQEKEQIYKTVSGSTQLDYCPATRR